MARFDLDSYETVEDRLAKFWEKYPNGRTYTYAPEEINKKLPPDEIIFYAEIYAERTDEKPFATGSAHEIKNASPVNRTSHVENCETSALGRALANGGFAARGKRPSREEMEKVVRIEQQSKSVSAEQIQMAQTAIEQVSDISSMDELKNFYKGAQEAGLLYIDVNGKNLNSLIGAHKKTLETAGA